MCWVGVMLCATVATDVAATQEKKCVPREARNTFQGAVIHGPVAESQCTECHDAHRERVRLLRDDVPALCMRCHDKPIEDAYGRTIPSIKAIFDASEGASDKGVLKMHRPFAEGDCSCCHDPHASSNERLLSRKHAKATYTSFSEEKYICFGCHEQRAFSEPRTLNATKFRNGNLNLHFRHVNRVKGRSCQLCHEHHASRFESLIREHTPFGAKSISISAFEKTANGGKCSPACHITALYDRLEPELNAMKVTTRPGEDATAEELLKAVKSGVPKPTEAR